MSMRSFRVTLLAGACLGAGLISTQGHATSVFTDDFNRPDSQTVGNGWVEGDANDVRIIGGELQLGKNQGASATQGTLVLSTVGYTNLTLSYDWRGIGTEAGDTLDVSWSADGTTFTPLASHDLANPAAFVNNIVGLGVGAQGLADIVIRFSLDANMGNDFARIDNVSLQGDYSTVSAVPLPAALPLFGGALGLAGLRGLKKRRRFT